MRIAGLQKLTLLDFPGKTAATVFTPGCNFRCPFCHNADLVTGEAGRDGAAADSSALSIDELFAFLGKRQGLLDGVCITGGEPLLQSGIDEFCTRVHELGFAVKLDTNGSFPGRLRALVEEGLVDYVATDVKNAPERYAETVGVPAFDLAPVQESLDFLRSARSPTRCAPPWCASCTPPTTCARWLRGSKAYKRGTCKASSTRTACWAAKVASTHVARRPAGTAARAAGRRAGRSAARGGLEPRVRALACRKHAPLADPEFRPIEEPAAHEPLNTPRNQAAHRKREIPAGIDAILSSRKPAPFGLSGRPL
ncbi:MAG: anaerobic ribonucleoside-triphosphate reductase activating protein [Eggerthella lenta]